MARRLNTVRDPGRSAMNGAKDVRDHIQMASERRHLVGETSVRRPRNHHRQWKWRPLLCGGLQSGDYRNRVIGRLAGLSMIHGSPHIRIGHLSALVFPGVRTGGSVPWSRHTESLFVFLFVFVFVFLYTYHLLAKLRPFFLVTPYINVILTHSFRHPDPPTVAPDGH